MQGQDRNTGKYKNMIVLEKSIQCVRGDVTVLFPVVLGHPSSLFHEFAEAEFAALVDSVTHSSFSTCVVYLSSCQLHPNDSAFIEE